MKKWLLILVMTVFTAAFYAEPVTAQCSICTKTAMQQGAGPAKGLNSGIIYLMLTPFAVVGFIGYRWYKNRE